MLQHSINNNSINNHVNKDGSSIIREVDINKHYKRYSSSDNKNTNCNDSNHMVFFIVIISTAAITRIVIIMLKLMLWF